jgi:hypothetical protein
VKLLSILVLLVALSAHALSVKDWEKKSPADRADYLGTCIVNLAAEIAETDRPLAVKIRDWYSVKPPGKTYTYGTYALFTRLVQLEKQEKDGQADLSKIEVEDIVYSITAAQFKLPDRESAAAPARVAPPAPAPAPSPAAKAPSTTPAQDADNDFVGAGGFIRPPDLPTGDSEKAASKPIMVGKIDVSQFAALKPGDTEARVVSLYGQAVKDHGAEKEYARGHLVVRYVDGVVKRVELYSSNLNVARSRAGNDTLLDLLGHSEADARALLGPSKTHSLEQDRVQYLFWDLPTAVRPEGHYPFLGSDLTLALKFNLDSGCFWISVTW